MIYDVGDRFGRGTLSGKTAPLNAGKVLVVAVNGSAQNEKLKNTAKWWRYADLIL